MTLKEMAIAFASHQIDASQVRQLIMDLDHVERVREGDDFYYEGDPDNTVLTVESLADAGVLSRESVNEFLDIIASV